MTVPHITDQNCTDAFKALEDDGFYSIANLCNKAIEIALAEQTNEQPLISADEARKLGAGAEFFMPESGYWGHCGNLENFPTTFEDGEKIKYRTINKHGEKYLTADEARDLGLGKAEWKMKGHPENHTWTICSTACRYLSQSSYTGVEILYRAKQAPWTGSRADVIALLAEFKVI